MQLGLDSSGFRLRVKPDASPPEGEAADTRWFLRKVVELGLDGFRLSPAHTQGAGTEFLTQIRDFAQEHGLYVEFGSVNLDPIRLIQDLKSARLVGASVATTYLGYDPRLPKAERERLLARAGQELRQVAPFAERSGVRIAVENHADVSSKELKELIWTVGSQWVGVCLDTTNNLFLGEEPLYAARELAPYVCSTRLNDCLVASALAPQTVTPLALGEGNVPLGEIIAILRQASGLERFTIQVPTEAGEGEAVGLSAGEEQKLRRSIAYAREVLRIG
jgi:sugar phosphate isomerase/epimerase